MASHPPGAGATEEGTPPDDAAGALAEAEAGPGPLPAAAEADAETPAGAAAAPTDDSVPDPAAAEAARAQAAGLVAVAVRSHPVAYYNAVFMWSQDGGFPRYAIACPDSPRGARGERALGVQLHRGGRGRGGTGDDPRAGGGRATG